ncbi:hypothetical protein SNEBB_001165 [Seison nebaliae]|nr:hypothetical protein SNEBB_001165 [Seison nebaliae]
MSKINSRIHEEMSKERKSQIEKQNERTRKLRERLAAMNSKISQDKSKFQELLNYGKIQKEKVEILNPFTPSSHRPLVKQLFTSSIRKQSRNQNTSDINSEDKIANQSTTAISPLDIKSADFYMAKVFQLRFGNKDLMKENNVPSSLDVQTTSPTDMSITETGSSKPQFKIEDIASFQSKGKLASDDKLTCESNTEKLTETSHTSEISTKFSETEISKINSQEKRLSPLSQLSDEVTSSSPIMVESTSKSSYSNKRTGSSILGTNTSKERLVPHPNETNWEKKRLCQRISNCVSDKPISTMVSTKQKKSKEFYYEDNLKLLSVLTRTPPSSNTCQIECLNENLSPNPITQKTNPSIRSSSNNAEKPPTGMPLKSELPVNKYDIDCSMKPYVSNISFRRSILGTKSSAIDNYTNGQNSNLTSKKFVDRNRSIECMNKSYRENEIGFSQKRECKVNQIELQDNLNKDCRGEAYGPRIYSTKLTNSQIVSEDHAKAHLIRSPKNVVSPVLKLKYEQMKASINKKCRKTYTSKLNSSYNRNRNAIISQTNSSNFYGKKFSDDGATVQRPSKKYVENIINKASVIPRHKKENRNLTNNKRTNVHDDSINRHNGVPQKPEKSYSKSQWRSNANSIGSTAEELKYHDELLPSTYLFPLISLLNNFKQYDEDVDDIITESDLENVEGLSEEEDKSKVLSFEMLKKKCSGNEEFTDDCFDKIYDRTLHLLRRKSIDDTFIYREDLEMFVKRARTLLVSHFKKYSELFMNKGSIALNAAIHILVHCNETIERATKFIIPFAKYLPAQHHCTSILSKIVNYETLHDIYLFGISKPTDAI